MDCCRVIQPRVLGADNHYRAFIGSALQLGDHPLRMAVVLESGGFIGENESGIPDQGPGHRQALGHVLERLGTNGDDVLKYAGLFEGRAATAGSER